MRSSRCRRRGSSLIELGVILGLSAVVMMMVAMVFSSLLKSQRQFLARESERREWSRVDAILRQDAHAAAVAKCETDQRCELSQGDLRWIYRVLDGGLVRERKEGERTVQYESFRLRPGTTVRFRLTPEENRTLLQLDLEPGSLPGVPGSLSGVPGSLPGAPAADKSPAAAVSAAYHGTMLVGGMSPQVVAAPVPVEGRP